MEPDIRSGQYYGIVLEASLLGVELHEGQDRRHGPVRSKHVPERERVRVRVRARVSVRVRDRVRMRVRGRVTVRVTMRFTLTTLGWGASNASTTTTPATRS